MERKPHINDHVIYQAHGSPNGQHKALPRAAIVTQVHDDDTVGLCILNPTGFFFATTVSKGTGPGEWRWDE